MLLPTCLPPTSSLPVLLLLHTSVPHCFVAFIPITFLHPHSSHSSHLPRHPKEESSATYPPLPYLPTYTRLPTLDWTVSATPVSGSLPVPSRAGQVLGFQVLRLLLFHPTSPAVTLGRPVSADHHNSSFILPWRSCGAVCPVLRVRSVDSLGIHLGAAVDSTKSQGKLEVVRRWHWHSRVSGGDP